MSRRYIYINRLFRIGFVVISRAAILLSLVPGTRNSFSSSFAVFGFGLGDSANFPPSNQPRRAVYSGPLLAFSVDFITIYNLVRCTRAVWQPYESPGYSNYVSEISKHSMAYNLFFEKPHNSTKSQQKIKIKIKKYLFSRENHSNESVKTFIQNDLYETRVFYIPISSGIHSENANLFPRQV